MKKIGLFFMALIFTTILMACSNTSAQPKNEKPELMVFAAAQLQDAFTEAKEVFEAKHDVKVTINFAGAQVLRTQIEQGAKSDVFASSDLSHMEALQQQSLVGDDDIFSYNTLAVMIPASNPTKITTFEELAEKKLKLVIGVENVPIGIYARKVFDNANEAISRDFKEKALANVVSFETNTRAVAGKVTMAEADAGIVYVTDFIESIKGKVTQIDIPDKLNVITTNTIAINSDSAQKELAQQWIDFLFTEEGQNILAKHLFMKVNDVQ